MLKPHVWGMSQMRRLISRQSVRRFERNQLLHANICVVSFKFGKLKESFSPSSYEILCGFVKVGLTPAGIMDTLYGEKLGADKHHVVNFSSLDHHCLWPGSHKLFGLLPKLSSSIFSISFRWHQTSKNACRVCRLNKSTSQLASSMFWRFISPRSTMRL